MKIGVWIDQKDPQIGGGFQYVKTLLVLLKEFENENKDFKFCLICKGKPKEWENTDIFHYLKSLNFPIYFLEITKVMHLFLLLRSNPYFYKVLRFIPNKLDKQLEKINIDLLYFPSPSSIAILTEKFNYIFTVWDLCHRDFPEFPEVYVKREFERREFLYKKVLPRSIAIFVDSEILKRKVSQYYSVDLNRIHIFPFLPGKFVRKSINLSFSEIQRKYQIKKPYIFYPAQFWSHKNHFYILKALKILKEKYKISLNAVFCGSDKGNLNYILNNIKKMKLEKEVKYIGFVSDEEMRVLYKNAFCLVMPTWFGPTNIPPLEAFALEVPVIYSDLPGLKEQVGDAALLVNLESPEDLAKKLLDLLKNPQIKEELIRKGKERLVEIVDYNYRIHKQVLRTVLSGYRLKAMTWKSL